MSHQIVKQPNGKFSLWSTILDDFLLTDCEPSDIIKYELEITKEEITENVLMDVEQLNSGKLIGNYTYEECLEAIQERIKNEQSE
jgi:hypothetical protein